MDVEAVLDERDDGLERSLSEGTVAGVEADAAALQLEFDSAAGGAFQLACYCRAF